MPHIVVIPANMTLSPGDALVDGLLIKAPKVEGETTTYPSLESREQAHKLTAVLREQSRICAAAQCYLPVYRDGLCEYDFKEQEMDLAARLVRQSTADGAQPIPLTEVANARSFDEWVERKEQEEFAKECAELERDMLQEICEAYLEAQGINQAATTGMSHDEILELAVAMGFDQDEAEREIHADMTGERNEADSQASDVLESPPENEPANRRTVGPVGGSAED